jgi:hypothetical protein
MVHYRHIQRHDLRFSRHGIGQHHLGKPVGPLRSAPDSADRIQCLGRSSGAGEPGDIARPVSTDLRPAGRRCDCGHLCAHDGLRDRLVRHAPQPGRVSGFRRHGNGANDHVSIGGTAHCQPRLENLPPNPRRARRSRDDSGSAAVSIYSVEGLAGLGGRVAFGFLGDRFGAKRVLVSGLLLQAFGALGYFFVRELSAFYAVAALFGFIYAGVMPLYAVLARENFPLRMMGTIIGGTAMAGSLGMATGPLAGGLIYDTFAAYGWLYIGAWGIGIGAFLIALTFKPYEAQPTPQQVRAAA